MRTVPVVGVHFFLSLGIISYQMTNDSCGRWLGIISDLVCDVCFLSSGGALPLGKGVLLMAPVRVSRGWLPVAGGDRLAHVRGDSGRF